MSVKTHKARKCGSCGEQFRPHNSLHRACSPQCALDLVRTRRRREWAKDAREYRKKGKTRSDLLREAQRAFNAYIRARDHGKPCICCGRYSAGPTRGGEWDAGHYRSVGAAPHLRFDERNCHAQLKHCNRYGFDVVSYRAGLVERIGLDGVESLECDQSVRNYTTDDLREIARSYRAKLRNMSKTQGVK